MDAEWNVIAVGAFPFTQPTEEVCSGNVRTFFVDTKEEAEELLDTCSEASVLISHAPPERNGFSISDALTRKFPETQCTVVLDEMTPDITDGVPVSDHMMIVEKPKSEAASALMFRQMAQSARSRWIERKEYRALKVSKRLVEEHADALIRLHEDLAGLVHCGQYLQETLDLKEACRLLVDTFKDLGMECTIEFVKDPAKHPEIRERARGAYKDSFSEDGSVRVFFSKADYAGSMNVRPVGGIAPDDGRLIDLVHLFKNQFVAFLDRFHRMEEREKILGLYNAVLEKLEEIVNTSDFNRKTQHVRDGIAGNTETIVKILDKLRDEVPEDVVHWIDEAEMSLQFADKVSQQINTLTGTLREVLCIMNPELAIEFSAQGQESSASVCEVNAGSQQDVDDLLAGLGM